MYRKFNLKRKNAGSDFQSALEAANTRLSETAVMCKFALLKLTPPSKSSSQYAPYYGKAILLNEDDTTFKVTESKSNKKVKKEAPEANDLDNLEASNNDVEMTDGKVQEVVPMPESVTIKSAESFNISIFNAEMISTVQKPVIVSAGVSAEFYNGKVQFNCRHPKVESGEKFLTKEFFSQKLLDLPISKHPLPERFPLPKKIVVYDDDGKKKLVDEKVYVNFVLPWNSSNPFYKETYVEIDEDELVPDRWVWIDSKNKLNNKPGINTISSSGTTMNNFKLVYVTEDKKRIDFSCGYNPDVFKCFGVTSLDIFKKVGDRLMFACKEAFILGYSERSRVMSIEFNIAKINAKDNDGNKLHVTEGFITAMEVNMAKSVESFGIKIEPDYVEKIMQDYTYETPVDAPPHPMNSSALSSVTAGKDCVINLFEMDLIYVSRLFKALKDDEGNFKPHVSFWGVYKDDKMYEMEGTMEERSEKITKEEKVPDLLYCRVDALPKEGDDN